MKKIKYYMAFLMAAIMVMGFTLTSMAAESGYYATKSKIILEDGRTFDLDTIEHTNIDAYNTFLSDPEYQYHTNYVILKRHDTLWNIMFYPSDADVYKDTWSSGGTNGTRYAGYKVTSGQPVTIVIDTDDGTPSCTVNLNEFVKESNGSSTSFASRDLLGYTVCASTPIYTDSSCTEVFLNAPTPLLKEVLPRIMNKVEMKGALDQVKVLLPICLAFLVGYLALRKALALFQELLHRA